MFSMMKAICMLFVAAIVLVTAVNNVPKAEAAIGCGTVVSYLRPCLPYVRNQGPMGRCCAGIKGLYAAARTTPDRRSVCRCLKTITSSNIGINLRKAAGLPKQCRVNIPFKISPSTDCSRVR